MTECEAKGKIFVAYHKSFQLINKNFITPVHAGRACKKKNKDSGKIKKTKIDFLSKIIGDDTGDNISDRNNEFNECSVLYWVWKNVDIKNYKYVGMFQYRRQLILNDYFKRSKKNNIEKKAYRCIHFKKINNNFCNKIGLTEENILNILNDYDCIVPYPTNLKEIKITSSYEDWVQMIPGVHVGDLVELEKAVKKIHPEMSEDFEKYLNSPQKLMYQIFIAKPEIFYDYCKWMFEILFQVDKKINTSLYSINGKRTLGYLAEILYGFYFTYMRNKIKIKECGVSFIDE